MPRLPRLWICLPLLKTYLKQLHIIQGSTIQIIGGTVVCPSRWNKMSSEDISPYAKSSVDFYDLLGVSFESSQKELDRAWRKTALKYHPDKVGTDATAKEKFHLAQIGFDLLSNPSSKQIYDNARNARLQRERQHAAFEGRRRQMKEDLESRERGVKRSWEESLDEEAKLARELQRLAEDGKRRRKEREDALRNDISKEHKSRGIDQKTESNEAAPTISELDRTVKVRWPAKQERGALDEDQIRSLFSKFGKVESADILKSAPARLSTSKHKQLAYTCMILYNSIVGAHAAVEDFAKQSGADWELFDSVQWALNKEPEVISNSASSSKAESNDPAPATSRRFDGAPSLKGMTTDKPPSFPSFSAGGSASSNPPSGTSISSQSPSLEEMTMIRLRKLERQRLAAEIDQEEAANRP